MIHHKQKTNPRFHSAFNVVTLKLIQLFSYIYTLLSQKKMQNLTLEPAPISEALSTKVQN
jgi:hypothetical protein